MSNRPRNFRQRRDVDGRDDDGDDKPNTNPPPKKPSAVASAKPKKKSLLSFVDDEEQEEALVPPQAKIKKSHKSSTLELEEAILAGGAAVNAVRDYQRKVQEMNCPTIIESK
ncbi:hypothetical protein ACFE04_004988 [Oxalis oulophora]